MRKAHFDLTSWEECERERVFHQISQSSAASYQTNETMHSCCACLLLERWKEDNEGLKFEVTVHQSCFLIKYEVGNFSVTIHVMLPWAEIQISIRNQISNICWTQLRYPGNWSGPLFIFSRIVKVTRTIYITQHNQPKKYMSSKHVSTRGYNVTYMATHIVKRSRWPKHRYGVG